MYGRYDGQWRDNIGFLPDIMATCVDVSGATYPTTYHGGREIYPLEGASLCPTVTSPKKVIHDYIYGEHFNNRYVRHGKWKAVFDQDGKRWELYNIETDRTEQHDLSAAEPKVLQELVSHWDAWAAVHHIYPKPAQ